MQASENGFDLEEWYKRKLKLHCSGMDECIAKLAANKMYYSLLFCHDFAKAFWKQGTRMTFIVPSVTYQRRDRHGNVIEVSRKAFTRRRTKPGAWIYHLREMASAEEPLRYIRRFLTVAHESPAPAHHSHGGHKAGHSAHRNGTSPSKPRKKLTL
jgi:hypothetical protein